MRITGRQLKQIIREEVSRSLRGQLSEEVKMGMTKDIRIIMSALEAASGAPAPRSTDSVDADIRALTSGTASPDVIRVAELASSMITGKMTGAVMFVQIQAGIPGVLTGDEREGLVLSGEDVPMSDALKIAANKIGSVLIAATS